MLYKLRKFNNAKLVAKRKKRENRIMFAKSRTYRAIDAWQEYNLTIYKLTDTVQFEGQLDNAKDPFKLWLDSSARR